MEWEVTYAHEESKTQCEFEGRHTYKLSIEEGVVTLDSIEPCTNPMCWHPEHDEIECPDLGVFKLKTMRECWDVNGKPTGHGSCDCNFWVELVPIG